MVAIYLLSVKKNAQLNKKLHQNRQTILTGKRKFPWKIKISFIFHNKALFFLI